MKQFTLRRPRALSPSGLLLWETDPTEYFLKYLAPESPPPFCQTLPMAIGSAFDSFVKGAITSRLGYGPGTLDLMRESVEISDPVERDRAISIGWYLFGEYSRLGYLAALMSDLELVDAGSVIMEAWCRGDIVAPSDGLVIPLCGKPDLSAVFNGRVVLLDWKCNGILSKRKTSPKPGWLRSTHAGRNGYRGTVVSVGGMRVAGPDGSLDDTWALQTCTYSWARMGGLVRDGLLCGVDQLVGLGEGTAVQREVKRAGGRIDQVMIPDIRIMSYRNLVSYEAQLTYIERYATLWRLLSLPDEELMSNWFPQLGRSVSLVECRNLVRSAKYLGLANGRDV